ncbi:portal protein [Helicobacter himalayensis]|uniref:portal protein n=1 Tax=Helicobacter himalayensis TaxID=1591088 RepID=UPI000B139570|nr:portal protein [Helicobacter himalayensis]
MERKTLAELTQSFESDNFASYRAKDELKTARAYYHGHQLQDQELSKLQARGQIPICENIFKMICDKILGYKIQSATEIKVSGRQEEDKYLANLLTDLLKVFNQQNFYEKEMYKRDFDLLMGLSVLELWVEKDFDGNYHLPLKHIPSESFLIDCYSTDKNATDATRFHKMLHIPLHQAKAILGKDKDIYIDRQDIVDSRVFLIESWFKESNENTKEGFSWNRYLWHKQGGIYSYEIMPFKNNTHPFIVAKYNIDEKNQYYGLFRDLKPIQDYINFAENKMANMMGTIKALYEIDAVNDIDEFVENISLDNAIVGVRSGSLKENKIQFVQHHADIQALSMKSEQKRNIARILSGLNDEALAQATNRQSGVAIAQRRDAGLLGLQYFVLSCDSCDRLLYEKVLSFIQHYFTKAQVFKITEKRRGDRYFNINTQAENTIKIGTFDLVYSTQLKTQGREERFAHWSEILKTISNIRPDIITTLLPLMLKDTDSQIVDDIEEILAKADESATQNAQGQGEIESQKLELEMQKIKAQIAKLEAEANKAQSQSNIIEQIQTETQNTNQTQNKQNPKTYVQQLNKIDLR